MQQVGFATKRTTLKDFLDLPLVRASLQAMEFHQRKYFRGDKIKSTNPAQESSPTIVEMAMVG